MTRTPALILLVSMLLLGGASTAHAQEGKLKFVDPSTVTVTAADNRTSAFSVWLRNTSDSSVSPQFFASLQDGEGNPTKSQVIALDNEGEAHVPPPVEPNVVRRYRLFIRGSATDSGASGVLSAVQRGPGERQVAPASVQVSSGPKSAADRGVTKVLWIPLIPAAVLVLVALFLVVGLGNAFGPIPTLDLDFKTSYASTLTAVGAFLATIVSAGVLPSGSEHLSKEGLVGLNLLFGLTVLVAPFVYSLWPAWEWEAKPGDPSKQVRKARGNAALFLLACFVTTWAVFGELLAIGYLVDELGVDEGFPPVAVHVFHGVLVFTAIAMCVYTLARIHQIVNGQRPTPDGEAEAAPAPEEMGSTIEAMRAAMAEAAAPRKSFL